jgi:segregation and condensation protein B
MFESDIPEKDVLEAIEQLSKQYQAAEFAFEVNHIGGGYQFMTKPAYQASISILLKQQSKKRLSNSAMETLSIIAYKQPVTKGEMEQIRGVNCDYSVQKLLEKGLIELKGKSESIGRPLLYGTSDQFMEYFGINEINELPTLKDFSTEENVIGEEESTDKA